MDFNGGRLLEGEERDALLGDLIDLVFEVANGRETSNEHLNIGEIGLFKHGVIL